MNLIRSLMGRRQFLVAAGVTSTSALAFKKLAGVVAPGFQTGVAMASDRPGTAGKKGEFSNRYSHLLSPIKIGNVVLKNRMLSTKALPHYLQGPETFPADAMIYHYANVAKNGAAVVTVPRQALQPKRLKTYVIPQLRLLLLIITVSIDFSVDNYGRKSKGMLARKSDGVIIYFIITRTYG